MMAHGGDLITSACIEADNLLSDVIMYLKY